MLGILRDIDEIGIVIRCGRECKASRSVEGISIGRWHRGWWHDSGRASGIERIEELCTLTIFHITLDEEMCVCMYVIQFCA